MVGRSRRGRPADADTPGPGGRSPAATASARSPVPPAGCSRRSSTADVAAPRNNCAVPATRLPAAAALRIPRTANRRTRRIDRTHPNSLAPRETPRAILQSYFPSPGRPVTVPRRSRPAP